MERADWISHSFSMMEDLWWTKSDHWKPTWCLELVFLHNILIRRRQFSPPEAEARGRRRGNLCRHAGAQGSGEWARRCFSSWGKSKVTTVQQTGVKGKRGSERGEPWRSCQTAWKQERLACNFWRMASQSLSPQTPDTRSWDRGIWVGLGWVLPVCDHPESR